MNTIEIVQSGNVARIQPAVQSIRPAIRPAIRPGLSSAHYRYGDSVAPFALYFVPAIE